MNLLLHSILSLNSGKRLRISKLNISNHLSINIEVTDNGACKYRLITPIRLLVAHIDGNSSFKSYNVKYSKAAITLPSKILILHYHWIKLSYHLRHHRNQLLSIIYHLQL